MSQNIVGQIQIVMIIYNYKDSYWALTGPLDRGELGISHFILIYVHSCFVEKYKMGAVQWENDFNTFLQTIVDISWFFRNEGVCWTNIVGGHLINIGDVYWWTCWFYTLIVLIFVTKERFNRFLSNRICLLIIFLHCMNAPWIVVNLLLCWCLKVGDYC